MKHLTCESQFIWSFVTMYLGTQRQIRFSGTTFQGNNIDLCGANLLGLRKDSANLFLWVQPNVLNTPCLPLPGIGARFAILDEG